MDNCKNCRREISMGNLLQCQNCGAVFCPECGNKTKMICPYCYSNLEYNG